MNCLEYLVYITLSIGWIKFCLISDPRGGQNPVFRQSGRCWWGTVHYKCQAHFDRIGCINNWKYYYGTIWVKNFENFPSYSAETAMWRVNVTIKVIYLRVLTTKLLKDRKFQFVYICSLLSNKPFKRKHKFSKLQQDHHILSNTQIV